MRGLFFGLTTIDIQHFVDYFPQENIKIKTDPPGVMVGGPATNAAITFAALSGESQLCSPIGMNEFTPFVTNDFNKYHLLWSDLIPKNLYHSAVLATVITNKKSGDRTIISHVPEDPFYEIDINTLFNPLPEILLIDGFYPKTAFKIAAKAKKLGIPVVFDGGSWKPWLTDLLELVDYAICSADFMPPNCRTSQEVIEFLKTFGISHIAITRGEQSILIDNNLGIEEIEIYSIQNVADTLGAGDIFHGAFCYYFIKNNDFRFALKEASRIAGISCQYKGTREWIQALKSVKNEE